MCTLVDLRIDVNPLTSPPAKLCSKGREHAFKWLRAHAGQTNDSATKTYDYTMKRPATINATLRRGQKYIENAADGRRFERRSRATRFNTVGGSDSGYASTVDENRYSRELQTITSQAGCLFNIDETNQLHHPRQQQQQLSSNWEAISALELKDTLMQPANSSSDGDLLKEVMHAYTQKMATGTDSSNSYGLCSLSPYHQCTTTGYQLYANSCITASTSNLFSSSTTSSTVQRPQAIVPPMTATVATSKLVAVVNQELEMKENDENKRKTNGVIPDIKNNNTFEVEQKFNHHYCLQCLTANCQPNTDHHAIKSIPYDVLSRSQKCLSPVIEDSNPSVTVSVSTNASLSSSTGNVSASGGITRLIAPSDSVSSSITIPNTSISIKSKHMLSLAKSSGILTSRSPVSNRTSTEKRNPVSSRVSTVNSRTTTGNSSLSTKSSLANNTKISHTRIHRSPVNHGTVNSTSTHVTNAGTVENMRKILEGRLNITLPSERAQLAASLADGVKLCNFANCIRLRAVNSLFTPASKDMALSPPKCRRNVDSFLAACRRIGVPEVIF
uniref:Calponin-homology (CH) domain-containing protein n=1 Tax=Setaria digitata TaxID=48799 RepID=A0A915PRK0_9BILA